MPTRRQLIQKITLNSNASSITFSNIPQNYTDLKILMSVRGTSSTYAALGCLYNGSSSNQTGRNFSGSGSSAFSFQDQSNTFSNVTTYARLTGFYICTQVQTAGTFSSIEWNISNYSSSNSKPSSLIMVNESNSTSQNVWSIEKSCSIWSNSSPISSLTLAPSADQFAANSTFYLYGITHVPIIRGGTVTVPGDGFKYHTFRSSGSLQVVESGDVECLAVAGGGGGGWSRAGGGGAGGLSYFKTRVSNGTQTVTIGAGGPGSIGGGAIGSNGQQTTVGSIISTSGGGGGGNSNSGNGSSGGSGGGGAENGIGGTGVSGQGNSGGSGAGNGGGGGGGGAASSGTNGTSTTPGPGGAGRQIFGAFYAGGGGGGVDAIKGTAGASGGIGGGASGSNSTVVPNNATPNTGGGGGGGGRTSSPSAEGSGSNGGSGIVIIRYPYDGN